MLWTALYFLVLLGLGCWYLFDWSFPSKPFKTPYFSPSNATIDQSLPDEILEHVMTFLDCQTVLSCRSVSKHWKYQSSKDRVLKDVLSSQTRCNRRIFSERLAGPGIELEWLDYNGEESLEHQLWDHALAAAKGTKLLEVHHRSLLKIQRKIQNDKTQQWPREFLLKVIGICGYNDNWDLCDKVIPSPYRVNMVGQMPRVKPSPRERCYLICDLYDYAHENNAGAPIKVFAIRSVKPFPKIAGFIPTTWSMPPIFTLYLFACLFHDYWTSSLQFGFWIALLVFILSGVFCMFLLRRLITSTIRLKAHIFVACHFIVLPILTYKYYVRFCELKAAVIFALTCYALQATLKKSGILRPKHFNMVVATVVALFVLTFDWSLILEKFSDGTMWQVLLTNTICYAVLCWEIIWINFGHLWADVNIIAGKKQSFRQLIFRWEKYMVLGMAKLSCMIIIASFYYPVTVM